MSDLLNQSKILEVPRGSLEGLPLQLDMTKLYEAESRMHEITTSNIATVAELKSVFNEACNTGNKYIAWIGGELLNAKRAFDLAKATVILDKLPDEVAKLKAAGLKDNADFRSAMVDRDEECRKVKEIIDVLETVKEFLQAKVKSFDRSYWDSKENAKRLMGAAGTPIFNQGNPVYEPQQTVPSYGTKQDEEVQYPTSSGSFIGVSKF